MSQPDSAALPAAPPVAFGCRVCGRGPARELVIRRHVGMIFMQRFVKLRAVLCREHGVQLTKQYLKKTLIEGWWGYISFFVNWFVVATDLVALSHAKKLAAPAPPVAPAATPAPLAPPGQEAISG